MTGQPILAAAEMRAAEQELFDRGVSVEALMERAGSAAAEAIWRYAGNMPVLVLCGPGNNGGDGYVVARILAARGVSVRVTASGEPTTPAAIHMRGLWDGPVEALADAAPAPLLVDALFGTGLSRALDPALAKALERLEEGAQRRIAVDLPSGVSTDDGRLLGPVIAQDLTVALGALKPAHLLQPAAAMMGRVVIADIGVATGSSLHRIDRPSLPAPGPGAHKYTRGQVVVVEGAMPGAALLTAGAAQRSGAGYVTLFGADRRGAASLVHRDGDLATLLADDRVNAVAIGPGLGRGPAARALLDQALDSVRPLVLDADALVLLKPDELGRRAVLPVLTPHEGEFAGLFGDLTGSKLERTRAAAVLSQSVIVLKGADTVVAAPDGRAAIAGPVSAWLASAGTGDVLAGAIAACRARGLDAFDAAVAGVWLHGEAARRAGAGLIADDLIAHLPAALEACA